MAIQKKYQKLADDILRVRRNLPTPDLKEFDLQFWLSVMVVRSINYGLIDRLSVYGIHQLKTGWFAALKWAELSQTMPAHLIGGVVHQYVYSPKIRDQVIDIHAKIDG